MALNNIKLLLLPQRARGLCKSAFSTDAAPFLRIANVDMPVVLLLSLPLTRDDVEFKVLIAQRGERARNEAFRPAIRAIFLANNGQTMVFHDRYLLAAETTASTGMASR